MNSEQQVMGQAVIAALATLQDKYPEEKRVAIWTEYYRDNHTNHIGTGKFHFVALVGNGDNDAYGYGLTPEAAAQNVIERAGDRDPRKMLEQKIEARRKELADLEAQLNPPTPEPVVDGPTDIERIELTKAVASQEA